VELAAIGISVHSGWGALVAITGRAEAPKVLQRKRIIITDPDRPGAKQPYHFAQALPPPLAEQHIAECVAASGQLAFSALQDVAAELRRDFNVAGCAVLLASGRALPALAEILKSHSLIHTAEGEFFRRAFWNAAERLELPVKALRERELEQRAKEVFRRRAEGVIRAVDGLGKSVGSPWTADQKKATLAALLVMAMEKEAASG
jgi:hypothetical protein